MNCLARCKPFLGTYVEISLEAEACDDELIALSSSAFNAIESVHNAMSFHQIDSELSRINNTAFGQAVDISPAMSDVLQQALALSQLSDGLFDITVAGRLVAAGALPDKGLSVDPQANWKDIELCPHNVRFHKPLLIDLGGIAKGYAVDCAIESLSADVKAVINAGGDLRMTHWQGEHVAIKSPASVPAVIELPMKAAAIATSACYYVEQHDSVIYHHNNPKPLHTSNSYSVYADSCMLADALTKIAYLEPDLAGSILHDLGTLGLVVDSNNQITVL